MFMRKQEMPLCLATLVSVRARRRPQSAIEPLLGREDLLEVAVLLRVRAVDDDSRPDDAEAQAVGR
jgi:hypothetical protein